MQVSVLAVGAQVSCTSDDGEHPTVMDELVTVGYPPDTEVAQVFEKSGQFFKVYQNKRC